MAAIADPSTHPRWRPSVVEFYEEDGRLVEVVRFAGRRVRTVYEVVAREPLALELRSVEGPVPVELRLEVSPEGRGSRVDFRFAAEPAGPLRLAPRLFDRIMAREARRELRGLKSLLEQHDYVRSRRA